MSLAVAGLVAGDTEIDTAESVAVSCPRVRPGYGAAWRGGFGMSIHRHLSPDAGAYLCKHRYKLRFLRASLGAVLISLPMPHNKMITRSTRDTAPLGEHNHEQKNHNTLFRSRSGKHEHQRELNRTP
ncbi:MAG: hypothetical protein U9N12_08950 [Euryarchaeota archaeon]|nr:hypothetical protein [Euryarchaeota archaeon]